MLTIYNGDLLDSDAQYIAHQANCISKGAAGVARAIYNKYPYSDVYYRRTSPSSMGEIEICGNDDDERFIINMFAQYYPGESHYVEDMPDHRVVAFKSCLNKISEIKMDSIAFPYLIGCGLGGGNWNTYLEILINFAERVYIKNSTSVYLLKKDMF